MILLREHPALGKTVCEKKPKSRDVCTFQLKGSVDHGGKETNRVIGEKKSRGKSTPQAHILLKRTSRSMSSDHRTGCS